MAAIKLSAPIFFQNGIGGVSSIIGVESTYNRVARFSFVAPSTGASGVDLSITGLVFGGGVRPETFRFYIGTDPNSHINAGSGTVYTGILNINKSTGVDFTGSASILLLPGVTYYLFIFPNTSNYGWFSMELASTTLNGTGGSYSVPTLDASQVVMRDATVTIKTNRHSNAFTHTIAYAFGNASDTIATNVTDSCKWTPSIELARQIPNAAVGVGSIYCTTYNDGVKIGETQAVEIRLSVPDDVVPSAEMEWSDPTGAYGIMGAYVQNASKLAVKVTGTGAYGSAIVGAAVTLDGKTYTGGVLTTAGSRKVVATVTDSRGRKASVEGTVEVVAYTAPQLNLTAHRCTEDGTADDTGEFCKVTLTGSTTQVNDQNTAALSFTYGSTTKEIAVAVGDFTHSEIIPAPSTATLKLSAVLSDALLSTNRSMVLSVGYATMDFLKGGRGIAFGATATREGFDCAMDAYFSGELYRLTVLGEKEWFFPPMDPGVEYRTANRWKSKPVYIKLIELETMPNNNFAYMPYSSQNATEVVDVLAYAVRKSDGFSRQLPFFDNSGVCNAVVGINTQRGQVEVKTLYDFSGFSCTAVVRYIKK